MRSHFFENSAILLGPSADALDEFDTEVQPDSRLLDIKSAGLPSTGPPAHLSRLESLHARRLRSSPVTRHGIALAVLLAIVSVGLGGVLIATWRQPIEARVAQAPARTPITSTPSVSPVPALVHTVPATPVVEREPVLKRATGGLTARRLTAMWNQRDTRSLEHAFAGLRRQTLAFDRCDMRRTADDRAVARCEGAGSTWTIDFQRGRGRGRWQIARVTTR